MNRIRTTTESMIELMKTENVDAKHVRRLVQLFDMSLKNIGPLPADLAYEVQKMRTLYQSMV